MEVMERSKTVEPVLPVFDGDLLPDGWQMTTIGKVCEKVEKVDPTATPKRAFRYIDIGGIDNQQLRIVDTKEYLGADAPSRARQSVKAHDVVVSTVRTYLRNIALVPPDLDGQVASTGFCVLRGDGEWMGKYLYYFVQADAVLKEIGKQQRGTSYPAVRDSDIKAQFIPLPPKKDLRWIVEAIERHLGRLDAAVARLHAAKAKLKRYKQAVLHEVFSEEWDTARLDEVCLKIQDGSHFSPKDQFNEPGKGRYKYITSKNIRNGYMNLGEMVYVTKDYFDTIYPRCNPELNDVLLTKDGANTGNVTLNTLDEPYALLSSVCLLKPDRSKLMPEFLMYFIQSPDGFKQLTGKMTGTAIKRIILERIREAPIPLPSLREQKQLVEHVSKRLRAADETDSTLDAQLLQATRLRQAVLKRAFEGRLV